MPSGSGWSGSPATKYPETLAFFLSLGYTVEASWDEPASSGTIFTLGGAAAP